MHLGYLQFQEKCLYGGVAFIIKILIKSLPNASYLFIPFTEDEMIDKIWIITIMMPWVSSTFEVWNERLFLRARYL